MKKILIILFIVQIGIAFAIGVDHISPTSAKEMEQVDIELVVKDGFNQIDGVELNYKGWGETAYSSLIMEPGSETDPVFRHTFTNLSKYGSEVEYYFTITDVDGNQLFLPGISPDLNPYRFIILQVKSTTADFILLSPDPELSEGEKDLTIAISFYALLDDIKPETIKFFMDGKEKTGKAKITSNIVLYQLKNADPGAHNFQISAETTSGRKLLSPLWKHTVAGKIKSNEFKYSGDATFTSRIRRNEEGSEKTEDDNHSLLLNLRGQYKKLKMRSRLLVSSREDSDEQAVNRYSLKLALPFLEFIGGDHSPNFGTFTAQGKNLRGIHTNLLFKGFRLYTSFGEIYRSVDGEATPDDQQDNPYSTGTFKRSSLSVRTEFGTKKLLQLAITFSKTKDKTNSLKERYYLSMNTGLPRVTPKDNIVASSDIRLALFRQRLVMGMEWAMSLYNDNIIGGAIDKDSLEAEFGEDIPFDPESFEDIFVINKNVSPIIPGAANSAYNIYLKWIQKSNMLNVSYSVVGSSFNSLAVNYLAKDTSILSIYDNLTLMQNRLILSLGLNLLSDNIHDEKLVTSSSTNIFAQCMYRPAALPYFSLSFSSNNSSNDQDDVEEDEAQQEMDLRSNNISFSTGYYMRSVKFAPTLLTAGFTNSIYTDEAEDSFEYSRNSFNIAAKSDFVEFPVVTYISYTLALNKDVLETYEEIRAETEKYETTYHSLYAKAKFSFREDQYRPYADVRYSTENGDMEQNSIMGNIGLSAELYRNLSLKTSIGVASYKNEDLEDGESSTTNFRFKLKYKF